MARTVNYPKRAEKIKEMIDDLVKEMGHSPHRMSKKDKIKLIDIDFENKYRRCNTNASTGTYQPPYS